MKYKFINFMRGRYGGDELYKFLLYIYLGLFGLNLFINSEIIAILELLVIVVMLYRYFSKDIYKRRKENVNYLEFKKRIKNMFEKKDCNYIYKKCHKCKKTLRLPVPSERGVKKVVCPVCKKKNSFFILQKVHIEVIKKKK